MAEQTDRQIASLSEAERFVVLEHVIEYISDVATLASLTDVSKRIRSAVYRSNGLRKLTFESGDNILVNEADIKSENREIMEENLKEGLRWLWTVGKHLQTVRMVPKKYDSLFYRVVLPLLNSLVTTEKRRIETIEICGMPCEMALDLVRENRNTLRCLRVELWDQRYISILHALPPSELPESQSFWSVVQLCERLRSLHLSLKGPLRADLSNVLSATPLKHLSLSECWVLGYSKPQSQKFIEVLSCDNLRSNLESLTFYNDNYTFRLLYGGLADQMISPRLSSAFMNIKKLAFEFIGLFCQQDPVNLSLFWTVFPAVNEITDNSLYFIIHRPNFASLSLNMSTFCKTFFEASGSRSRKMKIEIQKLRYSSTCTHKLSAAVMTAITLPEDQDWCISRGVQIETETHDENLERRVTLRNDTSTLVFDFTIYLKPD